MDNGTSKCWSGVLLTLAITAGAMTWVCSTACQSQQAVHPDLLALARRIEAERLSQNHSSDRRSARAGASRDGRVRTLGTLALAGDNLSALRVLMTADEEAAEVEPAPERKEQMPTRRGGELGGGFWNTFKQDIKDMPAGLWEDTTKVYWNGPNAVVLLMAGGASLALRPEVDDDIADKFDRARSLKPAWGDTAGVLGNPGTHFGFAGAAYLYSVLAEDAPNHERSKTLFSALIINGLSTLLLQVAANTDAPNGENLGWPSGHVSSTVTVAAVMDEFYGPWVGVPLYALAGFVGLERMDDGEHNFSDVVFGATLGYLVGKTVARKHKPTILGGQITPYVDIEGGASGVAWVKSF